MTHCEMSLPHPVMGSDSKPVSPRSQTSTPLCLAFRGECPDPGLMVLPPCQHFLAKLLHPTLSSAQQENKGSLRASQAGSDSRLFVMKTHQAKQTKQMLPQPGLLFQPLCRHFTASGHVCELPKVPPSGQGHWPGLSWQGHMTKPKQEKEH